MASKYAGLKGKIPVQQTEREEAIQKIIDEHKDDEIAAIGAAYNDRAMEAAALAVKVRDVANHLEAYDILLRQKLDGLDGEGIIMHGYTWSPKYEPYPVCEDPDAIVKYFEDHEMADQLVLTKTELANRLKSFVKEEALNGELIVEPRTVVDPTTGEERIVNDVKSQVPGVRVYLKESLSRVKSRSKA